MIAELARRWARWNRTAVVIGYVALVGVFGVAMSRCYQPGAGFNFLIAFGARQNLPQISELKPLNYLLQPDGYGYDAQYYAQIAIHPGLRDPELRHAIDSLAYRGRRILTCWTAYLAGLGRPAWVLQAYAAQNLVAWLVLAVVLLHWFPPRDWGNLFRWGGVLFCGGMCQSLRQALVDGPSLLLICLGVWAVEKNRRWLATAIFAVSGLARETNLLGAAALVRPDQRTWRHAGELVLRAVLVGAPLLLWIGYIHWAVGPAMDAGARNFNAPFLSYFTHWRHSFAALSQVQSANPWPMINLLVMIGLTTQWCFIVFRPRPAEAWWRVAACFAILATVLGTAVWEGYPGAAARVLLPMQMAFNVLVPRTRRWLLILVLGNLSILGAPNFLEPPAGYGFTLTGASGLLTSADGTGSARVSFDANWYGAERRSDRYWRWARGNAAFEIVNPHDRPVVASVRFYLDGVDRRELTVKIGDREVWRGWIGAGDAPVDLSALVLAPGVTRIQISGDQPPKKVGGISDRRAIAFGIRNLQVKFLQLSPDGPPGAKRD